MIELITIAGPIERAVESLATGIDTLYIGEGTFGLRLPVSFTRDEQCEIMKHAYEVGKQVLVAVNGIMHPEEMKLVPEHLTFLKKINVGKTTSGDPGTVFIMQRDGLEVPYVYDGEALVMSSHQINFWSKRGAIEAVLAREVPLKEMVAMEEDLAVLAGILVYGATRTHQSKRPLIQNYYNYTENNKGVTKDEELFISEPKEPEVHCSIYKDSHGTYIFANNDVGLMNELANLYGHHYRTRRLDGLYAPGENFVTIARLSAETKAALEAGTRSEGQAAHVIVEIEKLHPTGRGLDNGFLDLSADAVK